MQSHRMTRGFLSWTLIFLFACTTPSPQVTSPKPIEASSPTGLETLAIMGTNDIHGNLAPIRMKTTDPETKSHPQKTIDYETGGMATLAAYASILRNEFGDHFIWLDAGDEFQGTIESNTTGGAPLVQVFNSEKLHAAAIGNHEFDFGIPTLKARMSEAKYPYVSANITEKSTGQPAVFPNTYPSILLTAGQLKVGVIGLSTLDTPVTTRPINVKNYRFENLKAATLKEAESLRARGAQVILMTAHVGLECRPGKTSPHYQMRKPQDPQGECGNQDEMVKLLNSLPANTVDAVVAGHSHKIVHHWIAGIPVIQGGSYGRYTNVIYLTYDWSTQKVVSDLTRIEGPIPVCSRVFQNQNDCNGDRPAPKAGRGPLVAHRFHDQPVIPLKRVQQLIAPYLKKAEQIKNKQLGFAENKIEHFSKKESSSSQPSSDRESPLGNLLADAIRAATEADFALVNSGAIRAPLQAGPISYADVFRTFPFDNAVSLMTVSGQELLDILRLAESGARGIGSISGLRLKLIDFDSKAPFDDLDGSGKFEPWKVNRLLEAHKSDGTPISPSESYTLATIDFLVSGGDDMFWAMSRVPSGNIQMDSGTLVREALAKYIQQSGALNTEDRPLVDPAQPRIVFEKPKRYESNSDQSDQNHNDHHKIKRRRRHKS